VLCSAMRHHLPNIPYFRATVMIAFLRANWIEFAKIVFAPIGALWVFTSFFLADHWSSRHINLKLETLNTGETLISGVPHYYLTYRVFVENQST